MEPSHESTTPSSSDPELFAKLKQEHGLAKAVKSDDAVAPVDLWDQAVCRGPPSEVKKNALTVFARLHVAMIPSTVMDGH